LGEPCFTEAARRRAQAADVIVVNTHLYGTNIAAGGAVLPDHDLVVFDEAHQLEDTVSETCGAELTAGRFTALAHVVGGIIEDDALKEGLLGAGDRLGLAWRRSSTPVCAAGSATISLGARRGPDPAGRGGLGPAQDRLEAADVKTRRERAMKAVTTLQADVDVTMNLTPEVVAWVEQPGREPRLCVAPWTWPRCSPSSSGSIAPPS
jgi:ATP-dependent DNA helicase DinG